MIPTLKNVRLKEYGYIKVGAKVISGTVSKKLIDIMYQLLLMFICPLFLKIQMKE